MRANITIVAAGMVVGMAGTAFAGQWQQDSIGWKWQENDGSFTTNRGRWLDGNVDGVAEYYMFDETGHCYINTTTPNFVTVNENGAWVDNGVVHTATVYGQTPYDKNVNKSVMTLLNKTNDGYSTKSGGYDVTYFASDAVIEDMGSYYRISDLVLLNADATKETRLGNNYKLNIAKNAEVYTYLGFMSVDEGTVEDYLKKGATLTPGSGDSGEFTVCICPGEYDSHTDMLTSFMINLLY